VTEFGMGLDAQGMIHCAGFLECHPAVLAMHLTTDHEVNEDLIFKTNPDGLYEMHVELHGIIMETPVELD
jgi:hypothetical protein